MELLVASLTDPAGVNMARSLERMPRTSAFEVMRIDAPAINADDIESQAGRDYDGIAFLSRHAAVSGRLALTCHATGNFSTAQAGGRDSQLAVPNTSLIKDYICALWEHSAEFDAFDITLEATHHGPTDLRTPSAFVEIGTTETQWNDADLCSRVAEILYGVVCAKRTHAPAAVCFGGSHYPKKFTHEAIHGEFAPGTIVPKHALEHVDDTMMRHILERNAGAKVALLDSHGMGEHKSRILEMLVHAGLEVIQL